MKKYIVYIESTGMILRTGACPDFMVQQQKGSGEEVIVGAADERIHKIVDGEVVDKTLAEIEAYDLANTIEPIPYNEQRIKVQRERWENMKAHVLTMQGQIQTMQSQLQTLNTRVNALENP